MKRFKIIGCLAHQRRPGLNIEFVRMVEAPDIVSAINVYRKKLKGVKKSKLQEITEVL